MATATPTSTPIRARSRTSGRAIDLASAAPASAPAGSPATVPASVAADLADFWRLNTVANKASRDAEKAKTKLHKSMIDHQIKHVDTLVEMGDRRVPVQADIAPKVSDSISVEKLRALVDEATFLRIVKATKTAVVEVAGTNVAEKATVTVTGPEAMTVKEIK